MNVASYEAYRQLVPEDERINDIRAWLKAKLADMCRPEPQTSFHAWCALEALADQIQNRLDDLARHPDPPISATAAAQLRHALATIRADLNQTRPF